MIKRLYIFYVMGVKSIANDPLDELNKKMVRNKWKFVWEQSKP